MAQQFFSQTLSVRKSSKPHKFFMHASFFTVQDWGEFSAQVSQLHPNNTARAKKGIAKNSLKCTSLFSGF